MLPDRCQRCGYETMCLYFYPQSGKKICDACDNDEWHSDPSGDTYFSQGPRIRLEGTWENMNDTEFVEIDRVIAQNEHDIRELSLIYLSY